jgi:hypothetical protein
VNESAAVGLAPRSLRRREIKPMQARHRRRPPRTETERQQAVNACAAHLRDLKRVHGRPPADVKLRSVAVPQRLTGPPVASYCTSPAQLCAELAR